jgi:hypothetical protein
MKRAKYEFTYERSQAAGQMEMIMLLVAVVTVVAAIFAFMNYGWLAGLSLVVLSSITYALSRLFELIGDLFGSMNGAEESAKAGAMQAKND